ncbi:glycosidase [Balneicella halophila]|uniref:Glycosidase n=1 Tax=Balneicella halophila TaxID=1537566 RepID=A0A7L4UPV2_BALHA|nr:alpha-amylase family glycosyl hydrolase [Balneicella halophila]PVX51773.1 glycosidase [Balneicella halophila]
MNKIAYSFILIISFLSCNNAEKIIYPLEPATTTLLSPIVLDLDSTVLYLEDYVYDATKIDSISGFDNISWNKDEKKCIIYSSDTIPMLSTLKLHIDGQKYDLAIKKSLKQKVYLKYNAKSPDDKVLLKGEMTSWATLEPANIEGKTNIFSFTIPPGNYQYIYLVNDKEKLAPQVTKVDNNNGGYNSLLTVEGSKTKPTLSTYSFTDEKVTLKVENVENIIVFWENIEVPNSMVKRHNDKVEIVIPERASENQRSYIRVWGSNDNSFSNDILIPLQDGKVLSDAKDISRKDKHAQTLYSLMIDRFNNGKKENDHPLNRKDVLPQVDYQGGDIAGITKKINDGYFTNLGINTIWISPITQNPEDPYGQWTNPMTKFSGYHGYWPISSSEVDYRFGTSEELKTLLKTAHDNNINILLDYVANHVHEEHPFYKEHPNWVTPLYLPDGTKNTEQWDNHRLTTWFDDFMPTLDLQNDTVMEMMTDSALYWVENYDFDGFRHDATKHIPIKFWRTLTKKIRHSNNPTVYQIGETYGSRELIASYVSSGLLDAQFDFNLYDNAVACFAKPSENSFEKLKNALNESFNYFGHHHLMGNISGNHDRSRFISYASGDVKFDEDAKLAGWTRDITLTDTTAYAKLVQLNAFNLTIPGVPVIYQGDEYGVPGGNDPDNRRMMQFTNLEKNEIKTREQIASIAKLRRENLPLIYGDFTFLKTKKNILAYLRNYFDEGTIVIFNKSTEEKSMTLKLPQNVHVEKSLFKTPFTIKNNTVSLTLPANSTEIIY